MAFIDKLIYKIKSLNPDDLNYISLDFVYDENTKQDLHYLADIINSTGNVDIVNDEGITSLMFASAFGLTGIVQSLIELNANVNVQTRSGYSALMLAAEFGNNDIVQLLIQVGANIFLMHDDETALIKAVKASYFSTVKLIIEHGSKADRQEKLHILRVPCGPRETIYEILDDDLQLNRALIYALDSRYIYDKFENKEIIKLLINSGVNLKNDKVGNIGAFALYLAVQKNYKDIVEELLKYQINLNSWCYGITPLMLAIKENNLEMAQLLINLRADITLRANWLTTALSIAYKNKNKDAIRLLLKAYEKVKKPNLVDRLLLLFLR